MKVISFNLGGRQDGIFNLGGREDGVRNLGGRKTGICNLGGWHGFRFPFFSDILEVPTIFRMTMTHITSPQIQKKFLLPLDNGTDRNIIV